MSLLLTNFFYPFSNSGFEWTTANCARIYPGDRILEVNYVSVEQESLEQIEERIAELPEQATLLVGTPAAIQYYAKLGIRITR